MDENEIEIWKTKRLLKTLKEATGAGTSVVTLFLRPSESISKVNQKLTEELGAATNIKSRVNRQSVESAIKSAQQKLKLYHHTAPANGLAIFSGEVAVAGGKTKRLVMDLVPFKPLQMSLYMCDNRFHTEALETMLTQEKSFAFIIFSGEEFLLAVISGNTRSLIDDETTNLPSKTRRGGQSSARYGRLRDQAKNEWVKTICERLKRDLIDSGLIAKVEGIVLAGSADIKADLQQHAELDPAIKKKIIAVVDVAYGGKQGLHEAITLTKDKLSGLKFVQERDLLSRYFEAIATDGAVSYGLDQTMAALEAGVVQELLLWDKLETVRQVVETEGAAPMVVYREKEGRKDAGDGHVVASEPLVDWIVEHHKDFGAQISFVSDATGEAAQFIRGFGGIGAFLRFKMALDELSAEEAGHDEVYDD
jgi:peptide chain release factor subunit 1